MVIDMESLDKLLRTLFPEPKYGISCIGTCEVFSICFYSVPILCFCKPNTFADEYAILKSIFDLDQVGLYRYDIKGFKDDSK